MKRSCAALGGRVLGAVALLSLILLAAGCGGPGKGDVSGTVTFDGKAMPGGSVTFLPEGADQPVGAVIGQDGTYKVEGLRTGTVKVGVAPLPPPPAGPGAAAQRKAMAKAGPPKDTLPPGITLNMNPEANTGKHVNIPEKYQDPKTSGLSFTVKSGENKYDIELKK